MIPDRPRHQVLIGVKDVSERCDSIVYSATDTGGFEIATLGLPAVDRPKKGETVTIRQGLEVAWAGRVAEVADHSQHQIATKTTGCEGLRALLRDTLISPVYVDRDLTQWSTGSVARQIFLLSLAFNPAQFSVTASPDQSGNPGFVYQAAGPLVGKPLGEMWYDAGPGNKIAFIRVASGQSTGYVQPDALALLRAISSADDAQQGSNEFVDFGGAASVSAHFIPTTPRRFAALQHYYNSVGSVGAAGTTYGYALKNISVFGDQGLQIRGVEPADGFYPSDIARHALSQCANVSAGVILDATGYIAPHVVYRTATPTDTIIDDMAKLMGWPWGVWDSGSILGTQPRLDFRPPPTDATAVVTKAECDQLDVTSRLGDLYNTCQVTFTDAAGSSGLATAFIANPQLTEAGIATRTLQLDMGLSSQAAAQTFASFALALSQVAARAAGSATLPVSVRLPGGGSKPACLLRPGIDKLRIVDLVDGGPAFDIGQVRRDVFRISRVETTVAKDGSVSTVAELDSGTNLLETLQARLALSAAVVGSGAS